LQALLAEITGCGLSILRFWFKGYRPSPGYGRIAATILQLPNSFSCFPCLKEVLL